MERHHPNLTVQGLGSSCTPISCTPQHHSNRGCSNEQAGSSQKTPSWCFLQTSWLFSTETSIAVMRGIQLIAAGTRSTGQTYDKAYSLCKCAARDGHVSAQSQVAHKLRIGKVMAITTFDGRQSLQCNNLSVKITMQKLHTLLILIAGPTSTRRRLLQGSFLSNMQSPLQCCNCT